MKTILLALGFMAVFEALLPLVKPELWLRMLQEISRESAARVRTVAMVVMGLALLFIWAVMLSL